MVKPLERNTRYVDAVMTVPKNVLYPMVSAQMDCTSAHAVAGCLRGTGERWPLFRSRSACRPSQARLRQDTASPRSAVLCGSLGPRTP
jgi:hypothetical protein